MAQETVKLFCFVSDKDVMETPAGVVMSTLMFIVRGKCSGFSDALSRSKNHRVRKKQQLFAVTEKGIMGRAGAGSALRSLRFHFFFVALGATVALHSMLTNQSLASMVNVGWIWYNNLWVIISELILGRN